MLDKKERKIQIKDILIMLGITTMLMLLNFNTLAIACIAACVALWPFRRCIAVVVIPPVIMTCAVLLTPLFRESVAVTLINALGCTAIGLISGIMFKKQLPNRIVLTVLCILLTALLFATLSFVSTPESTSDIYALLDIGTESIVDMGIDLNALSVAAVIFTGIIIGAFDFIAVRYIIIMLFAVQLKRKKTDINRLPLRNILPMPLWCLSKNYSIGLFASIAAVIAVNVLNIGNAAVITYALVTIFFTPICMQGICASIFYIRSKLRSSLSAFLLMFAAFVIGFPFLFVIVGLIDQFTRYRARKVSEFIAQSGVDIYKLSLNITDFMDSDSEQSDNSDNSGAENNSADKADDDKQDEDDKENSKH